MARINFQKIDFLFELPNAEDVGIFTAPLMVQLFPGKSDKMVDVRIYRYLVQVRNDANRHDDQVAKILLKTNYSH